jgi:hypothetical protein
MDMILNFTLLKGEYSIYGFSRDSPIPGWIYDSDFYSVTRTSDELSIICKPVDVKLGIDTKIDYPWKILKICGVLDLSLIGIIATVSTILKENKIPIFTISTFDTDYILVKERDLNKAIAALRAEGHKIQSEI